jgi:hypothetical protein
MARVFSFSEPPLKNTTEFFIFVGVKITQFTQSHPVKIAERPIKTPF